MTTLTQFFTNRRVAVSLLLGFSSGLPLALTAGTLQAWLVDAKVDIRAIGWFSLVGLPYTWKFLWSPFFDRFTTRFLGPRRGWILILQLLLVAGLIGMGAINPVTMPYILATMAVTVAFLSASQDIVVDAYRTEMLHPAERGPGASAVTIGARLALLASGAGALILSDHLPWHLVYVIMAVILGAFCLATLWGPEPARAITHPTSLRAAVLDPLRDFFRRKGSLAILGFVVLYKFGDAVSVALLTPFLMQTGFSKTEIGTVFKGMGMAATIVGALVGGGVVGRIGINRSLWIFGILQALSNLGYLLITYTGHHLPLLFGVIGFDQLCAGLGTAAFVAFLMAQCNVHYTATQYALLTSAMAIARTTVGAPAGYLVSACGWPTFFVISLLVAIPGLALLAVFAPWRKPTAIP
ncbi:MAG: AmpG family muropeptide MFS transporter [Deltaproteobacteria bacterium]|nr:AmpG family muropeptide MFS transporter [Deltaproteobacteria bacterium]